MPAPSTPFVSPERHVPLEAVFNFRDLGGRRSHDGRVVRWGVVFRADGLHRTPEPQVLADIGVRVVIDLRTYVEAEAGMLQATGVRTLHLPMMAEPWALPEATEDATAYLASNYLDMTVEGAGAIAETFEILASGRSTPLVFHCAAGKDRTGVMAALLLAALGVDDEQIAADYHLSAEAMVGLGAWYREAHPEVAEQMTRQPPALLAAPPEAILAFLDGLRIRHGTVADYLESIGLGAPVLAQLEAELLIQDDVARP